MTIQIQTPNPYQNTFLRNRNPIFETKAFCNNLKKPEIPKIGDLWEQMLPFWRPLLNCMYKTFLICSALLYKVGLCRDNVHICTMIWHSYIIPDIHIHTESFSFLLETFFIFAACHLYVCCTRNIHILTNCTSLQKYSNRFSFNYGDVKRGTRPKGITLNNRR